LTTSVDFFSVTDFEKARKTNRHAFSCVLRLTEITVERNVVFGSTTSQLVLQTLH
jgi:hypothetical protein